LKTPYWTVARFDSTLPDGTKVRKGERIFYYPATRSILVGEKAEAASREWAAMLDDERRAG
jgi:hypothetical protein